MQAFDKWVVDFVGPISPTGKRTSARYIIAAIDYLTRWAKALLAKYCIAATAAKFLFENIMTRFSYLNFLICNQGTHFFNQLITELIEEF